MGKNIDKLPCRAFISQTIKLQYLPYPIFRNQIYYLWWEGWEGRHRTTQCFRDVLYNDLMEGASNGTISL